MEKELYLSLKEAADYLRMSEHTLRNWKKNGVGPEYYMFGRRVKYTKADLDTYIKNNFIKRRKNDTTSN